jgi:hypothetical protein
LDGDQLAALKALAKTLTDPVEGERHQNETAPQGDRLIEFLPSMVLVFS